MASRKRSFGPVALDAQLSDRRVRGGRARAVLIVGELSGSIRSELVERGADVTSSEHLSDAFDLLARTDFDVVVLNPFTDNCAFDFLRAIKENDAQHEHTLATLYGARGDAAFLRGVRPPAQEVLDAARTRHAVTPFVVLPASNEWTYSIVVAPPHASVVRDAREIPLATTILTVDASTLIIGSGPLA